MIGRLLRRRGILGEREKELRVRERELLERLSGALARFGTDVAPADLERFREAREQLDRIFLIVVVGEFNSGKSSFINALLGERVLPEGVTPTTDRITVLRHGEEIDETPIAADLLERTHPAEILRELHVVDTPGTNAVIRRHEELTREFVPRCDLVLFVTSADRPFTESERAFLEQIREWGKKVTFVVNKVDILASETERRQVEVYVRENAADLLDRQPEVFAVSARLALEARKGGEEAEELWRKSGVEAVEIYLVDTLDRAERVRLKLLNPLNVGLRLAERYKEAAFERLRLLSADVETIENIDRQIVLFHEEMLRDLEPRLSRIEVVLDRMERRGLAFFDETIRIGRIRTLLDSDRVKRDFARQVIGDTPQRIDEEVEGVIDWIVERNLKLWQDIDGFIDRKRLDRYRGEMIGEVGHSFDYNRQALLGSIGRASQEVIGEYDREAEARAIANEVQGTFAVTAIAEVGAVGLGALVATVITGAAADMTGILLATTLAVGGFYVIPRKRRRVKKDFTERIEGLHRRLAEALRRQAQLEIERSSERIEEAIAPYRRFVRSKQEELSEARGELVATEDALLRLREEIERS